MSRKGIILAGGTGSRLFPLTFAANKQLLPVFDKPMIYYPLSTLMLAGIRDILIIAGPDDLTGFRALLGDGDSLGMSFSYQVQPSPDGLPQAFILGRGFIGSDPVALALGDNIFSGDDLGVLLRRAESRTHGATIITYPVDEAQNYGVAEFDEAGNITGLDEKPIRPTSDRAITGLYFFDNDVIGLAAGLTPSSRGELEIIDLLRLYLARGNLQAVHLDRSCAWLDAGSFDTLLEASNLVAGIQRQKGCKIACIEEIAWRQGWIDAAKMAFLEAGTADSEYGRYLQNILKNCA